MSQSAPKKRKLSKQAQKVLIALGILCALILLAAGGFILWRRVSDKERYQVKYPDLILEYAQEYDLDPYLVSAVIHTESRSRPDALSHAGAVGLMQVMPETGEWIAGHLGIAPEGVDLTDPETNVEMGCWYLRFLLDRFEVQDTAIAAYNAGQGNVGKWLEDEQHSTNSTHLESIPFPETEQYVVRVNEAYDKIQKYYPDVFDEHPGEKES